VYLDGFLKRHKIDSSVIPAKAGIQYFQYVLDSRACPGPRSGVRRSDKV
jgi:hypothetical protein